MRQGVGVEFGSEASARANYGGDGVVGLSGVGGEGESGSVGVGR